MQEFIKQNWVALLSLIIALIGGAPGIIAILNYFRQKSIFDYTLAGMIFGESPNNKGCILILSGTILNAGDKPLVPASFDLEVKIGKNWNKMTRMLIPNNSKFGSKEYVIQIKEPWKNDLQKNNMTITQITPSYGHLMFTNKTLKKKVFKNNQIIYKIICTDIFGKKYTLKLPKINNNIGNGLIFPKHGLSCKPIKI